MSGSPTANFKFYETEISQDDILPAPVFDGTKFITGALKASADAHLKVRLTVQNDIAHALNCKTEALSFMWARPVKGAETLDCAIPDFRDAFLEPIKLKLTAE